MFESVLIANRGEIAVRIIRTLRRLGITSIAVFSDLDADARHVREADLAVHIGPTLAASSYLSIERIVTAALSTGAQAIHPGYGFLSENAAFARACADAGIVFIGPSADAIETMGDKISARRTVSAAGIPVVPGASGADLIAQADAVGYPLLVKPSAGGGGKGIHLVESAALLPEALDTARREAAASFGDDTLLLEHFVERPRHIEVQVLADTFGTVVHLGERECSLQRRHQKVIEEAPSPFLTDAQREKYGALAVAVAQAVDYQGVGTVELIVADEKPDEPYFMEMNTRLQVEHPVTELVTGIDLVEAQLRVAAGEPLSVSQSDITLVGHAIEARVYAEDPDREFLPTGGSALAVQEPSGDGIRFDSALLTGVGVGTAYDPMLAKVIAYGADRATAIAKLRRALAQTALLGVTTNLGFLRELLALPDVQAGRLDTGLLERSLESIVNLPTPAWAYAAFAFGRLFAVTDPSSPWTSMPGRRLGGPSTITWTVVAPSGDPLPVTLVDGSSLVVGDTTHVVCASKVEGGLLLTVDGVTMTVLTAVEGTRVWAHNLTTYSIMQAPVQRLRASDSHAGDEVRSPLPGAVVAVHVRSGEPVTAGTPLVVVEAMKMEYVLRAPRDGEVSVLVHVNDQVVVDQLLATVSEVDAEESDA